MFWTICASALFCLLGMRNSVAFDITGKVTHIVDGDTFDIQSDASVVRIRICGIDSPERGEKDYFTAADELAALILGKELRCVRVGEGSICDGRSAPKNQRRIVAQCFLGAADIAAEMIAAGAVCDWPRFSGGYYQTLDFKDVCVRK